MRHGLVVAYLDAGAEDKVKEIVEVTYSSVYFMLKKLQWNTLQYIQEVLYAQEAF